VESNPSTGSTVPSIEHQEKHMQIKGLTCSLAAAALLFLALPAAADETRPYHGLSEEARQEVRERWNQMSPEERAEVRRQADEYWAGLSEEERAAKREELRQHQGGRSRAHGDRAYGEGRGATMTPEERQAHREEMRKRWEAMTPEERQAHRGMMRSPQAADPRQGEYAPRDGKGKPGGAKGYGKDKPEE
jgi:hypothetical protein